METCINFTKKFANFTSLKNRIALQVARKIAPCGLNGTILNSMESSKSPLLLSSVHARCQGIFLETS